MKKFSKIIPTLVVSSLLLAGCGTQQEEVKKEAMSETTDIKVEVTQTKAEEKAKEEGPRILVDDLGNEVEIPETLERIVIADLPPLVHAVYAVNGGTEGIIGAPTTYALEENLFPTVYPEVLELETGFRKGGDINIEELLSLQPDLILYRADNAESAKLIQDTGIPAVAFQTTNGDNGNVITPVASWIEDLSFILGKDENSLDVEQKAYEAVGFVQSRVWDIKEQEKSAYLTAGVESIKMLGDGQFGNFWAQVSHTYDVGAADFSGSKEVSIEQLYTYDPDIIYLGLGSISAEEFLKDPRFQNLTAVKEGRVYRAPEGLFSWYGPSTDIPLAFLWHAKLAYPEQFEDVDLVSLTKDYYKTNYDFELTQENLEFLFTNSLEAMYAKE